MKATQKDAVPLRVPCPRCGKKTPWKGNAFRPFCSQRCQQFDLAAWASDEYRLPGENAPADDEGEEGG